MEIQGRGTHSSYYFKYSPCQQEIQEDKDRQDDAQRQHHGEFHDEARLVHPVVNENKCRQEDYGRADVVPDDQEAIARMATCLIYKI